MRAELTLKNGITLIGDFKGSDTRTVSFRPENEGSLMMMLDRNDVESIRKAPPKAVTKKRKSSGRLI